MTWGKVSDDLHGHPKWRGVSPNAKALWATALSYCSAYLTNGVVAEGEAAGLLAVETFGANREAFEQFDRAAAELVKARLWARRGKGWVFHQWAEHQPAAEDEKARKWKLTRSKQLHRSSAGVKAKAAVIERDQNRCRYCGVGPLITRMERAEYDDDAPVRTFDHVDPDGPNSVDNLVLACHTCNNRKNGRALSESGMSLLTPGTAHGPRVNRASAARATEEVPSSSTREGFARVGSGRVGSGRDGEGLDGQGQGAGSGTGEARGLRVIDGGAA